MKPSWTKTLPLAALCAASAFCLAAAPSMASADTRWMVDATFDDGTTLTGTFTINQYGYLSSWDLTTQAGALDGFAYENGGSYNNTFPTAIDLYTGPPDDPNFPGNLYYLNLQFTSSLSTGSPDNIIIGGEGGPSYECQASYSCYDLGGGDTRFIVSGFANEVPEPATWALMLAGFGGLGVALRTRRARSLAPA